MKYADECLQFYDAKCPVTTPNAQVMLRVMESVYDIDDQKVVLVTVLYCTLYLLYVYVCCSDCQ